MHSIITSGLRAFKSIQSAAYRFRRHLGFPADPFRQVDLHRAGEMIEPVRMAGEDEDLEGAGGRIGIDDAFGSPTQDFQDSFMFKAVGVRQRVVENGKLRFVFRQHTAQSQANQQTQLLPDAIRLLLQRSRLGALIGTDNNAFRKELIAKPKLAVFPQADKLGPFEYAFLDGSHDTLDAPIPAFFEKITQALVGVSGQSGLSERFLCVLKLGFRVRELGVQALAHFQPSAMPLNLALEFIQAILAQFQRSFRVFVPLLDRFLMLVQLGRV